tara:strand:+ start:103 stop:1911 length:1809 start_codon:yes stop_codon:yes gene_type:complete
MNTNKELWSDDYLKEFAHKVILSQTSNYEGKSLQFWYEDDKKGICINSAQFINRFCPELGIRNLILGKDSNSMDNPVPVFIRGNRIEQMETNTVKTVILKVLTIMDELIGEVDETEDYIIGQEVKTKLGLGTLLTEKGISLIQGLYDKKIIKDDVSSAYRFFRNGYVLITKEGVSPLTPYSELPENVLVWNSSVIDKDYSGSQDFKEQHFRDFVENLSLDDDGNQNIENLNALKLGIGYLCHTYHNKDQNKWVVALDRNFDPNRKKSMGGNGKSVLFESLKSVMNIADVDGREFVKGKSDKYAFANVDASTELCFIDDANEKFDWSRLYGRTTGAFEVRKMATNPIHIPNEDAPKICISSNFPVPDDDPSTLRRSYQMEISSFYSNQLFEMGLTPKDIHGGKFIAGDDWDDQDWSAFYHYIWECISFYLDNGLPKKLKSSPNQIRSRLLVKMGTIDDREELLDFYIEKLKEYAKSGKEIFVEYFYRQVREHFQFLPNRITNKKLYEWLKDVGNSYGYLPNPNEGKTSYGGVLKLVRLAPLKKEWVACGMNDYRDKNGKDPLSDKLSRVYVFKVENINPPEVVVPPNTTAQKLKSKKGGSKNG